MEGPPARPVHGLRVEVALTRLALLRLPLGPRLARFVVAEVPERAWLGGFDEIVGRWQAEVAAWAEAQPDAPGRVVFVAAQTVPLTRAIDPTTAGSSIFLVDPALRAAVAACKEKGMTHASVIGRTLPDGQPDLFAYDDYRVWLRDRYAWQAARVSRRYTKTLFARGVCSASHIGNVMRGVEPYRFNADHVVAFAQKWGLPDAPARYLDLLVRYTHAADPVARARLRGEMVPIPGYRDARSVDAAVFHSLSSLVQLAIYELARTPAFRPDPDWIRGALRLDVTRDEVRRALLDLVRAGALQEGEDGRLGPNPQPVRQRGEGHRDLYHRLHDDLLSRAERAATDEPERCRAAWVGVRVPLALLPELERRVRALELGLAERAEERRAEPGGRAIYQVTLQILPGEVPA